MPSSGDSCAHVKEKVSVKEKVFSGSTDRGVMNRHPSSVGELRMKSMEPMEKTIAASTEPAASKPGITGESYAARCVEHVVELFTHYYAWYWTQQWASPIPPVGGACDAVRQSKAQWTAYHQAPYEGQEEGDDNEDEAADGKEEDPVHDECLAGQPVDDRPSRDAFIAFHIRGSGVEQQLPEKLIYLAGSKLPCGEVLVGRRDEASTRDIHEDACHLRAAGFVKFVQAMKIHLFKHLIKNVSIKVALSERKRCRISSNPVSLRHRYTAVYILYWSRYLPKNHDPALAHWTEHRTFGGARRDAPRVGQFFLDNNEVALIDNKDMATVLQQASRR
ncbi:unnamed protein product [Vitrella brassicaformis CCMP3155]|uniref:Uncharacterized protein n=1 Tax=Vitrella brassicaformis (strain CCMP3155) TaxID=1169540 RepID=A0A0G4GSY5_VITBC|nr:unnamed protein product [Vitrella brassicaformis CCMP3155]|eukprot:CEM33762.1 unnamed protein product [Vitrella brassicaformis CCMP3155]